jgi:2-polyprenyl-3-methyl-5-hydroxy-6-metoxy-1,4-benzoquinol methylase
MKTHSITNKEFLERELKANIGFHGDQYIGLMRNTYNTLRAITGEIDVFVDLGAGTGVLSAVASEDAGRVRAFDTNPEHKKYFKANATAKFPSAERVNYCDCDFTKKKFRFGGGNIVLACIEVTEHIPQPEYERFLENVEDRADWFLFSSTPNSRPGFDEEWGHINIHQTNEWIEIHERFGWELHKRLTVPTSWSLLFMNKHS